MKLVNIIGVSLLFIFGFLFLKEGITGMYLYDAEDVCSFNTECLLPKVCCHFYEESSGVCDYQSSCGGVYLASKQEKSKLSYGDLNLEQKKEITFKIEQPKKVRENSPLVILGLLMLILAVLYVINKAGIKKKENLKR